MASLAVYFDESGIHGGSPIVVVAGIIASTKQWQRFDGDWRHILRSEGITIFHMKDFAHSQGEFRGWNTGRKESFIKSLIETIKAHTRVFIVHAVKVKDFETIKAERRETNISAYQLCCEQCMTNLVIWAQRSKRRKEVAVHFESGNKIMSEVMALYNMVPDSDWLKRKWRINHLGFSSKADCTPLQAADLLAYEIFKYHSDPVRPLRRSLKALLSGKKYEGYLNTPATISNWFDLIRKNREIS